MIKDLFEENKIYARYEIIACKDQYLINVYKTYGNDKEPEPFTLAHDQDH